MKALTNDRLQNNWDALRMGIVMQACIDLSFGGMAWDYNRDAIKARAEEFLRSDGFMKLTRYEIDPEPLITYLKQNKIRIDRSALTFKIIGAVNTRAGETDGTTEEKNHKRGRKRIHRAG